MQFTKIAITKTAVTLERLIKDAAGVEESSYTAREKPLATFVDALQAFSGYFRGLLPFELTEDQLTITTLNLSQDKNGLRGLIVTGIVPVPKAYGKPIVINTPLVREGGENPSADAFVLTDVVLDLVEAAEAEAARYLKGDRVQGELFERKETSANTKAFNERAASAEVATTKKPRASKKEKGLPRQEPGRGLVMNPDSGPPPNDEQLRQLLLSVERDVPVDAFATWTSSERESSIVWAKAQQRKLLGALKEMETVPLEPVCIAQSATPPMLPPAARTSSVSLVQ